MPVAIFVIRVTLFPGSLDYTRNIMPKRKAWLQRMGLNQSENSMPGKRIHRHPAAGCSPDIGNPASINNLRVKARQKSRMMKANRMKPATPKSDPKPSKSTTPVKSKASDARKWRNRAEYAKDKLVYSKRLKNGARIRVDLAAERGTPFGSCRRGGL